MIENELERLRRLIHLSTELAEIKDLDILMEQILQSAREFVNCDAGSIYIKKNTFLKFSYTQNDTLSGRLEPGQKLIYNTLTVPINTNSVSGHVALSGGMLNCSAVLLLSWMSMTPCLHGAATKSRGKRIVCSGWYND